MTEDQKPKKPEIWLAIDATDEQARRHYSMMLDYYIALSNWYERRLLALAQCHRVTDAAKIAREALL